MWLGMCRLTQIVLSLGRCRHLKWSQNNVVIRKTAPGCYRISQLQLSCKNQSIIDKNLLPHNYASRLQKRNSKIFIFFQCVLTCLNKFWTSSGVEYEQCCSGCLVFIIHILFLY